MSRQSLQSELQLYLREINEVPLLTPEEEKDLGWRIINDNDQDAKEQMIKANLRLVRTRFPLSLPEQREPTAKGTGLG